MNINHYKYCFVLGIAAILLLLFPEDATAQCAMCRATVENNMSDDATNFASNLNLGIIYLFAAPYILVSVVAILWYKKSKANARKIRIQRHY